MASIYDLKPAFQGLLRPISNGLAKRGFTANQVTVFALLLSLAAAAALTLWPGHPAPLLALPALLFIRMALNAIDGMMAREHHMKSHLGLFLNELSDVVADAALILPLAFIPGVPAEAVVLFVLAAVLTEMTGICAVMIGAERRYDGPMGKSDRAFILGLVGLLLGLGVPTGIWLDLLLWAAFALCVLTIINRARKALTAARSDAATGETES